MQGRIAGFLMTIFMALPLAAIPLMSIFGIPQFGSLAATIDETGFLAEDPIADTSAPSWSDSPAPVFGDSAQDSTPVNLSKNSTNTPPVQTTSLGNSQDFSTPSAFGTQENPSGTLTWDQGIARLAQMGITDYRIQPGIVPGTSHFACYARPASKATVLRFEAEANDPLQALLKTLKQVEPWHSARSQSSNTEIF
ncbi:hypothetical protein [Rubinisphaera italica]|uniref:Uncharacterized protein n=1 Tax=Rubinisphaera italica TaxID=2527969 RepID=A0A5C5XBL5_9PLAN|nr:hypothetical protein [Rubinisphaera italica]TWT60416.1 hypothetical protein Pan54_11300 [Rubinisphaera italica]